MGNILNKSNINEESNETNNAQELNNIEVKSNNTNNNDNSPDLDDLNIEELISYIKISKQKKLDINDNFAEKIKDVTLDNMMLIPMSIEFYEKVAELVPEYKNEIKMKYGKYQKYIKPKFGADAVVNSKQIHQTDNNDYLSTELDLGVIPPPTTEMNNGKITLVEFMESFDNPPSKIDMIGMSKKMIMNMPNYHKTRLINCYNRYLVGSVDSTMCFGRSSYIYKEAKNGPKESIDSFREIVTIPNTVSQYHRILALRLSEYLEKNNYIDKNIQKGAVSGIKYSVVEQIYKVKNVLKDANENKKSICMLFLDISNAFGSLNRTRLFEILEKYNVDKKFINYIQSYYDNFKFYATSKDWTTELMDWQDGLVQGCPLSSILFVTAINYVLRYLDDKYKQAFGYSIKNDVPILFTAFIDDVCVIAKDADALQEVYNKLKFLFACLGLKLNASKSAIMTVNCNTSGFDGIPVVKNTKYLGEILSCDGLTNESYKEFISELGKKLFQLDKKKVDNATKLCFFSKCMLPWVQRKMMIMYDIDNDNRHNIVAVLKKYLQKWGNNDTVKIFSFITDLLLSSHDIIIKNAEFDKNIDEKLMTDIDLANCIINDANIDCSYSSINKSPKVTDIDEELKKI